MPSVGWDGRDVSGLSHEQIHRWTRDGASPDALGAARDRHLVRADELRTAAGRLETAQRGVADTWAGRDADAAGARSRLLAQRMDQLARTVDGQARGLDGMRAALLRVQAAVGPPRPPALPGLGVTPVLDELRSLVAGRPADGYAGFRAAATDQAAAREAYRSYLGETAAAARGVDVAGAGPPAASGTPAAPTLAPGARGSSTGVLHRAAAGAEVPTGGSGGFGRLVGEAGGLGGRGGFEGPGGSGGPASDVPGRAVTPAGPEPVPAASRGGAGVGSGSVGEPGPARPAVPVSPTLAETPAAPPAGGVRVGAVIGGRGGGAGGGSGAPGAGTSGGWGDPRAVHDQRAPSVPGGRSGPPRGLVDHERGPRPGGSGGPGSGGPGVAGGPGRGADDAPEPGDVPGADGIPAPRRHVSYLVDPDPPGWGGSARRVAPPVLGEGPWTPRP